MDSVGNVRSAAVLINLLFAVSSMVGCSGEGEGTPADSGQPADGGVTYTEHVAPILNSNCVSCHGSFLSGADRNGAPTGVDFDSYQLASENADAANARIQAETMPPAGQLSSDEKSVFQTWVDLGTPE